MHKRIRFLLKNVYGTIWEKFYFYIEWLQYLIDEYFKPQGYELNGKINYRGERLDDIYKRKQHTANMWAI